MGTPCKNVDLHPTGKTLAILRLIASTDFQGSSEKDHDFCLSARSRGDSPRLSNRGSNISGMIFPVINPLQDSDCIDRKG